MLNLIMTFGLGIFSHKTSKIIPTEFELHMVLRTKIT